MSAIDKIQTSCGKDGNVEFGCSSDEFALQYPNLFEIIAKQRHKGKTRKTGGLKLSVDCGKACLCLTTKESGHCAFFKADGFAEALNGLESQLDEGSADWRKDRYA